MEKIDESEEAIQSPPEAEESTTPVTVLVKEFQELKEKAAEELKEIKESKAVTKPELDISVLTNFKDKVIKEFGLTEKIDVHGCFALYYNGFIILKLLPRKNCRFGVWREVPEDKNRWRAFRIKTDEEEQVVLEHIKLFIESNAEE